LPYDSPMPQINPDSMIAIQSELTFKKEFPGLH